MDSILTVTAPASTFDLTTITDVKADLGITNTDSDALLTRYVSESSIEFANACNRVFAKETVSELFRPDEPKRTLVLTRRPVVSITSVTEDGDVTDASDYETDLTAGLIYRLEDDCRCAWGAAKIVVVYQAGYVVPASAPKDLQKAIRAIVKAQFLSKGRDPLVRSESVPGVYEVAYWVGGLPGGEAWPADIKAALDRYSNPLI